jgi:hypothetical protein
MTTDRRYSGRRRAIKLTWLVCLTVILLAGCASFGKPARKTDEQIGQWMTYYYLRPSPEQVPAILASLAEARFVSRQNSIAQTVGFFAEVFNQNGDSVEKWVSDVRPEGASEYMALLYAIALSDVPSKASLLKRLESRSGIALHTGPFPHLVNTSLSSLEPVSGDDLDLLWGAFMASGKELYVRNIIEAMKLIDVKDDRHKFMVGLAARWSLVSNALQHPKVREICKSELSVASVRKAELLREMLELESM